MPELLNAWSAASPPAHNQRHAQPVPSKTQLTAARKKNNMGQVIYFDDVRRKHRVLRAFTSTASQDPARRIAFECLKRLLEARKALDQQIELQTTLASEEWF